MRNLLTFLFFVASICALGQPASDIWLFKVHQGGSISLSLPQNVTPHVGYDNQPSFHPSQPYLYYASFNDSGRSDILRYNWKTRETVNITTTREREYSPTVTPDQQFLSCIIQRDNGAQDLGKYPIDGGEPALIIDNMTVGYHLWVDNSHVVMFILGKEGQPHTLHYMRLPTKEDTVIATNIGRSLGKVPGTRSFSFIQKGGDKNRIMVFDTETSKVTEVATTPGSSEDIAWTQDGRIIGSDGTNLLFFNPKKPSKGWRPITIKGAVTLKGITRIAADQRGEHLAVVVSE